MTSPPTTAKPRGIAEVETLEAVFNALAHESRRTILAVLSAHAGEMTSKAIASRFDCSWPTTSRHLRVLQEAGLVHVVLKGRERIYQLDSQRMLNVAGRWIDHFK